MTRARTSRQAHIAPNDLFELPVIRPKAILEALWRRKLAILATILTCMVLGTIVGLLIPRTYTSSTQILLDPRGLRVLDKDISPVAREADQSVSVVESEMRFMASELVLNRVVKRLDLAHSSTIMGSQAASGNEPDVLTRLIQDLRALSKQLLGRDADMALDAEQLALAKLQKLVHIPRQPNTYVIDVQAKTENRELSVKIANAIAEEYIAARFKSRNQTSERAAASI
ncbi:MAG: Wzz/FepE/Etk N-terminal domain-containing protein, partial [Hyphomicrobiaceae bacterium]